MASASKSAPIPPSQRVEVYGDIEARIQAALTFISTTQDDYRNLASLAKSYEIPLERLRDRWQGRKSKLDRPGANWTLSEDQEAAVRQYLDRLDMLGTCARLQMVSSCANAILQKSYIGSGTAPIVSEQWARPFLARHPEYYIRKQRTIDVDRKNAHQPDDIRSWFEKYKLVCEQYRIQTTDTYNFDETGFRIGIGRDQWIMTRDPNSQSYLGSSTNREPVTVCEIISGDGSVLPPMIIVSGIIHKESWYTTTTVPDNYLIGTSETGYTNDELRWSG